MTTAFLKETLIRRGGESVSQWLIDANSMASDSALSWEEIENAPMVSEPLNKYMFCSPAEGGCAH